MQSLTDRRHAAHQLKPAFANQRPRAFTTADEVDHVNTTLIQLFEFEFPSFSQQRRVIVFVQLFFIGHQTIQRDIRVDFSLMFTIKITRVDFKNFDNQLVDVFGKQLQLDNFIQLKELLVSRSKIEIDPVQQGLVLAGRQHRSPRFTITFAR